MTQDINPRVCRLFEVRLKNDPDVSDTTIEALLEEQGTKSFGDDDEILKAVVEATGGGE